MTCRHCLRRLPVSFDRACMWCQGRVDRWIAESLRWQPDHSKAFHRGGLEWIPGKEVSDD
ncbi:hypothetical protein LCGC14_0369860 [marine sediment metagenome]|uniref:Uncharacterized protein n=1 Tax=marine sediment metagenome TaxID=412755 RepID=A0A0F9TNI3_9ZZZZ